MPKFNADHAEFDFPCPQCGEQTPGQVGRLRTDGQLVCPAGHRFTVDLEQFDQGLRAAEDFAKRLGFR